MENANENFGQENLPEVHVSSVQASPGASSLLEPCSRLLKASTSAETTLAQQQFIPRILEVATSAKSTPKLLENNSTIAKTEKADPTTQWLLEDRAKATTKDSSLKTFIINPTSPDLSGTANPDSSINNPSTSLAATKSFETLPTLLKITSQCVENTRLNDTPSKSRGVISAISEATRRSFQDSPSFEAELEAPLPSLKECLTSEDPSLCRVHLSSCDAANFSSREPRSHVEDQSSCEVYASSSKAGVSLTETLLAAAPHDAPKSYRPRETLSCGALPDEAPSCNTSSREAPFCETQSCDEPSSRRTLSDEASSPQASPSCNPIPASTSSPLEPLPPSFTALPSFDALPPSFGAPPSYSAIMHSNSPEQSSWRRPFLRTQPSPPFIAPPPPPTYIETETAYQHPVERSVIVTSVFPSFSAEQAAWGPDPVAMVCPSCNRVVVTTTESHRSNLTHFSALGLCLCGCWPCCLLPYCMDSCKNTLHFCPNCRQFLGMYRPW